MSFWRYARVASLLLIASNANAAQPSFSCSAARSWDERAICGNDRLSGLDLDLNRAFHTARAERPDQAERLVSEQRSWVAHRAKICSPISQPDASASTECLTRFYGERIAALIRIREGRAPIVSMQHSLNRGASDPKSGEVALASAGAPPELALAAWLAFVRGDIAVATQRIEAAEKVVRADWESKGAVLAQASDKIAKDLRLLDDWVSAPGLAPGPALLRRVMSVFRRHDLSRKINGTHTAYLENFLKYTDPWNYRSDYIGSDQGEPEAYALRLPCRIFRDNPEMAIDAFLVPQEDRLSTIVGAPFDCSSARLVSSPDGRMLVERLKGLEGQGRLCGKDFKEFHIGGRPIMTMAALITPRIALERLGGTNPETRPEQIFPDKPALLNDAWQPATKALAASYIDDSLPPDQANRLAKALLAELTGPSCEMPVYPKHGLATPSQTQGTEAKVAEILGNLTKDPKGAERQLRLIEDPSAKAVLAVLLHEYRPKSPKTRAEIEKLLKDVAPRDEDTSLYNGTTKSLVDAVVDHFPREIPCALIRKDQDLRHLAGPRYASSADGRLPYPDCNLDRDFSIPPSVKAYIDAAKVPAKDFVGTYGGSMRFMHAQREYQAELSMHLFPRSFLKTPEEYGEYGAWRAGLDDWLPFENWSYLSLSNRHTFDSLSTKYRQARDDLAQHYQSTFGLNPREAAIIARRALQAFAYEGHWTRADRSGLRHMILSGVPTTRIAAMLAPLDDVAKAPETKFNYSHYEWGWTFAGAPDPLPHIAVGRPDVLRLLLEKGADPRATNPFKKTAPMAAAQENNIESLRILLAAGAPVHDITDGKRKSWDQHDLSSVNLHHDGRSALHYAAASGGLEVIRLLLDAGADPQQPDNKGLRPVHYLLGEGPVAANRVIPNERFREAVQLLQ